jgi:hypothetical protein
VRKAFRGRAAYAVLDSDRDNCISLFSEMGVDAIMGSLAAQVNSLSKFSVIVIVCDPVMPEPESPITLRLNGQDRQSNCLLKRACSDVLR